MKRWRLLAIALALLAGWLLVTAPPGPRAAEDPEPDSERTGVAYLGVNIKEETERPDAGARVTGVVEGSPAERAGIREGDVIVGVGGDTIRGPLRLRESIQGRRPGDRVEVEIIRDGKPRSLEVELGNRRDVWSWGGELGPVPDDEWLDDLRERSRAWAEAYREWHEQHGEAWAEQQRKWREQHAEEWAEKYKEWAEKYQERAQEWAQRSRELADQMRERFREEYRFEPRLRFELSDRPRLGVHLVETTPELRRHLGGDDDAGVLIGKVLSQSPAERAGVKVGDLIVAVDGRPVVSARDLRGALAAGAGKTVTLVVVRDGRRRELRAELPETGADEDWGPQALALPAPLASPPALPRLLAPAPPAPLATPPALPRLLAPPAPSAVPPLPRLRRWDRIVEDSRRLRAPLPGPLA